MKKGDFVYLNSKVRGLSIEVNDVGIIESIESGVVDVDFISKDQVVQIENEFLTVFDPKETGDLFEKKVCNVCHKILDTFNFDINQRGKNNRLVRRPSCKDCRIIIDGVKLSTSERKRMKKVKPHFVKFTCPICEKTTIAGFTSKLVIDHDHKNGTARAWICDSCNTGLGRFKDDVRLLEKAIEYLKSYD